MLTDEDREKKAEASIPGTFNVIVNPESFQHLPEYSADDAELTRGGISSLRRGSIAASLTSSIGRDSMIEAIPIPDDPNTVILPRFEDLSRRPTRELKSPTSPIASTRTVAIKREESDAALSTRGPEITSLRYFRDVVWRQLVPPEHGQDSSIILLDEAAAQFPAVSSSSSTCSITDFDNQLIRAMVAVGSLAMSQQDGGEPLDSLQQYSETLPELKSALKSEEDLALDGALLTHFLMLVYEVRIQLWSVVLANISPRSLRLMWNTQTFGLTISRLY